MNGTLVWNGSHYEADYDETRKLYVDGDAFSEALFEACWSRLRELHPEMSIEEAKDTLANTEEGDKIYDKEKAELLDDGLWTSIAVEVDEEGMPLDKSIHSDSFDAWIQ